ncbi:MAG: hypothetical protein JWM27_4176 [Gemmatimonadetes bacterium]|nr:hypothetical protein [Gemmatimonadota bacterium]
MPPTTRSEKLRTPRRAALAVLLAAWAAGACAGSRTPQQARAARARDAKGDVLVAAVWPWEAMKEVRYGQGVDMAVEEVNAAGGVLGRPLRIRREDDKGSVNEGRLIAERLGQDPEVMAVIGHLQSYVTVPAAAIYDLGGLVMLAPASTSQELTSKGYARIFRGIFTDRAVGQQMAEYAVGRGYRRVAIYYVRSQYGRDLANAFEERATAAGATVVTRASYDPGQDLSDASLEQVVREWKEMGLDCVFLAGEVPQAGALIASIRHAGVTAPILGGDAMSSPGLISVGGAAVEGTVVGASFSADEPRPEVQRFTAAFQRRWGVQPDAGSALGYDAVRVLARAMQVAKTTDPDSVARALHTMPAFEGVTGPFAFNESGDLKSRHMVRIVVHGGRFAYADAATPARVAAAAAPAP